MPKTPSHQDEVCAKAQCTVNPSAIGRIRLRDSRIRLVSYYGTTESCWTNKTTGNPQKTATYWTLVFRVIYSLVSVTWSLVSVAQVPTPCFLGGVSTGGKERPIPFPRPKTLKPWVFQAYFTVNQW